MCGFAALFEPDRTFPGKLLDSIDSDLRHRGPDSSGRHSVPGCALVFRRLAILDPESRSDQPFWDASGRYVIVFNGEIYNYRDIRRTLTEAGVRLRTYGDTEAIVEGFARWGESIIDRLEGMFAFCLFDTHEKVVRLVRDPLGIKPLYVARQGKLVAAASEMHPLRRVTRRTEVDPAALAEVLLYRHASGRMSNLKGIDLLPGGTIATYRLDAGHYAERIYADRLDTIQPEPGMTRQEALDLVEDGISESVLRHMQSDVGYSVQFSGGVDSSVVLALSSRTSGNSIDTYSIRLPGSRFDESAHRTPVVELYHPAHHEYDFNGRGFADALPRALFHLEGPSAHLGCVLLMLLCDRISEKHKVVLTGEGADEFFGGYDRYGRWRRLRRFGRIGRMMPSPLWNLLPRYKYLRRFSRHEAFDIAHVFVNPEFLASVFPSLDFRSPNRAAAAARFTDFREKLLALDQTCYLNSLLLRQDKMSMAAGVEARVPFTHYPLARALNRIPLRLRIPGGETKPLLKAVAEKWLPREVIYRRKVGLGLPLKDWLLDSEGLGRYLDFLTEPGCRLASFGEAFALRSAVEEFRRDPKQQYVPLLSHLINVEVWLRSLEAGHA